MFTSVLSNVVDAAEILAGPYVMGRGLRVQHSPEIMTKKNFICPPVTVFTVTPTTNDEQRVRAVFVFDFVF